MVYWIGENLERAKGCIVLGVMDEWIRELAVVEAYSIMRPYLEWIKVELVMRVGMFMLVTGQLLKFFVHK
ncbi:hypothetical protein UB51_24035 [Paenibacillus sp. IHBB 10380]|nr:hypothetical protein UB51_24035 [Paenibacillus sp. IHBB 10380]